MYTYSVWVLLQIVTMIEAFHYVLHRVVHYLESFWVMTKLLWMVQWDVLSIFSLKGRFCLFLLPQIYSYLPEWWLSFFQHWNLQVVKEVAVLAGVCATDPFRRMDNFLKQLESVGFCGVQNFPTVGLFDGNFRQNLEETGMGYGYVLVDMF